MRLSTNTLLVALACFVFFTSTAEAAISRAPNNLGLVGYWSFDDCKLNKATDSSGYGNTGTLTNFALSGAASNWVTGAQAKRGCALNFDGTNDSVDAGNSSTLKPTDVTISIWAKYNALTEYMIFSGNNADWGNYTSGWVLEAARTSAGTVRPAFFTGAGNYIHSTQPVSVGRWYHIVGTYNSTSNVASIYVDGVRTSTTTNADIPYGTSNLIIGSISGDRYFFNGSIDEYRIYNRALSPNEVSALYNTGAAKVKAANNNGLVGYWSFDDCKLNKASDSSGQGNTGTLTNFALSGATSNWMTGAQAKRGCALNFDGTNDYVEVGVGSSIVPAVPHAVAFWFKMNANNDGFFLSTNSPRTEIYYNANIIHFTGSGGTPFNLAWTYDANWHHIVWTDAGSGNYGVYLDGVARSSSGTAGTISQANFRLGAGIDTTGYNLQGSLDDVRLYNRVLSANEVTALYNTGAAKVKAANNNGLVGYWSFDDCKLNKATDSSGYGNTGTLTNFALSGATSNWMTGAQAKRGCALNFDGSNDYVSVPDSSAWDFGTNDFTVSWWERRDTLTAGQIPLVRDTSGFPAFAFGHTGGTGTLAVYMTSNGSGWDIASGQLLGTVTLNTWNHFIVKRSGSTFITYQNGVQTGTFSSALGLANSSSPMSFGHSQGSYYFDGSLDEIRIYNRALSANEVTALYNAY